MPGIIETLQNIMSFWFQKFGQLIAIIFIFHLKQNYISFNTYNSNSIPSPIYVVHFRTLIGFPLGGWLWSAFKTVSVLSGLRRNRALHLVTFFFAHSHFVPRDVETDLVNSKPSCNSLTALRWPIVNCVDSNSMVDSNAVLTCRVGGGDLQNSLPVEE